MKELNCTLVISGIREDGSLEEIVRQDNLITGAGIEHILELAKTDRFINCITVGGDNTPVTYDDNGPVNPIETFWVDSNNGSHATGTFSITAKASPQVDKIWKEAAVGFRNEDGTNYINRLIFDTPVDSSRFYTNWSGVSFTYTIKLTSNHSMPVTYRVPVGDAEYDISLTTVTDADGLLRDYIRSDNTAPLFAKPNDYTICHGGSWHVMNIPGQVVAQEETLNGMRVFSLSFRNIATEALVLNRFHAIYGSTLFVGKVAGDGITIPAGKTLNLVFHLAFSSFRSPVAIAKNAVEIGGSLNPLYHTTVGSESVFSSLRYPQLSRDLITLKSVRLTDVENSANTVVYYSQKYIDPTTGLLFIPPAGSKVFDNSSSAIGFSETEYPGMNIPAVYKIEIDYGNGYVDGGYCPLSSTSWTHTFPSPIVEFKLLTNGNYALSPSNIPAASNGIVVIDTRSGEYSKKPWQFEGATKYVELTESEKLAFVVQHVTLRYYDDLGSIGALAKNVQGDGFVTTLLSDDKYNTVLGGWYADGGKRLFLVINRPRFSVFYMQFNGSIYNELASEQISNKYKDSDTSIISFYKDNASWDGITGIFQKSSGSNRNPLIYDNQAILAYPHWDHIPNIIQSAVIDHVDGDENLLLPIQNYQIDRDAQTITFIAPLGVTDICIEEVGNSNSARTYSVTSNAVNTITVDSNFYLNKDYEIYTVNGNGGESQRFTTRGYMSTQLNAPLNIVYSATTPSIEFDIENSIVKQVILKRWGIELYRLDVQEGRNTMYLVSALDQNGEYPLIALDEYGEESEPAYIFGPKPEDAIVKPENTTPRYTITEPEPYNKVSVRFYGFYPDLSRYPTEDTYWWNQVTWHAELNGRPATVTIGGLKNYVADRNKWYLEMFVDNGRERMKFGAEADNSWYFYWTYETANNDRQFDLVLWHDWMRYDGVNNKSEVGQSFDGGSFLRDITGSGPGYIQATEISQGFIRRTLTLEGKVYTINGLCPLNWDLSFAEANGKAPKEEDYLPYAYIIPVQMLNDGNFAVSEDSLTVKINNEPTTFSYEYVEGYTPVEGIRPGNSDIAAVIVTNTSGVSYRCQRGVYLWSRVGAEEHLDDPAYIDIVDTLTFCSTYTTGNSAIFPASPSNTTSVSFRKNIRYLGSGAWMSPRAWVTPFRSIESDNLTVTDARLDYSQRDYVNDIISQAYIPINTTLLASDNNTVRIYIDGEEATVETFETQPVNFYNVNYHEKSSEPDFKWEPAVAGLDKYGEISFRQPSVNLTTVNSFSNSTKVNIPYITPSTVMDEIFDSLYDGEETDYLLPSAIFKYLKVQSAPDFGINYDIVLDLNALPPEYRTKKVLIPIVATANGYTSIKPHTTANYTTPAASPTFGEKAYTLSINEWYQLKMPNAFTNDFEALPQVVNNMYINEWIVLDLATETTIDRTSFSNVSYIIDHTLLWRLRTVEDTTTVEGIENIKETFNVICNTWQFGIYGNGYASPNVLFNYGIRGAVAKYLFPEVEQLMDDYLATNPTDTFVAGTSEVNVHKAAPVRNVVVRDLYQWVSNNTVADWFIGINYTVMEMLREYHATYPDAPILAGKTSQESMDYLESLIEGKPLLFGFYILESDRVVDGPRFSYPLVESVEEGNLKSLTIQSGFDFNTYPLSTELCTKYGFNAAALTGSSFYSNPGTMQYAAYLLTANYQPAYYPRLPVGTSLNEATFRKGNIPVQRRRLSTSKVVLEETIHNEIFEVAEITNPKASDGGYRVIEVIVVPEKTVSGDVNPFTSMYYTSNITGSVYSVMKNGGEQYYCANRLRVKGDALVPTVRTLDSANNRKPTYYGGTFNDDIAYVCLILAMITAYNVDNKYPIFTKYVDVTINGDRAQWTHNPQGITIWTYSATSTYFFESVYKNISNAHIGNLRTESGYDIEINIENGSPMARLVAVPPDKENGVLVDVNFSIYHGYFKSYFDRYASYINYVSGIYRNYTTLKTIPTRYSQDSFSPWAASFGLAIWDTENSENWPPMEYPSTSNNYVADDEVLLPPAPSKYYANTIDDLKANYRFLINGYIANVYQDTSYVGSFEFTDWDMSTTIYDNVIRYVISTSLGDGEVTVYYYHIPDVGIVKTEVESNDTLSEEIEIVVQAMFTSIATDYPAHKPVFEEYSSQVGGMHELWTGWHYTQNYNVRNIYSSVRDMFHKLAATVAFVNPSYIDHLLIISDDLLPKFDAIKTVFDAEAKASTQLQIGEDDVIETRVDAIPFFAIIETDGGYPKPGVAYVNENNEGNVNTGYNWGNNGLYVDELYVNTPDMRFARTLPDEWNNGRTTNFEFSNPYKEYVDVYAVTVAGAALYRSQRKFEDYYYDDVAYPIYQFVQDPETGDFEQNDLVAPFITEVDYSTLGKGTFAKSYIITGADGNDYSVFCIRFVNPTYDPQLLEIQSYFDTLPKTPEVREHFVTGMPIHHYGPSSDFIDLDDDGYSIDRSSSAIVNIRVDRDYASDYNAGSGWLSDNCYVDFDEEGNMSSLQMAAYLYDSGEGSLGGFNLSTDIPIPEDFDWNIWDQLYLNDGIEYIDIDMATHWINMAEHSGNIYIADYASKQILRFIENDDVLMDKDSNYPWFFLKKTMIQDDVEYVRYIGRIRIHSPEYRTPADVSEYRTGDLITNGFWDALGEFRYYDNDVYDYVTPYEYDELKSLVIPYMDSQGSKLEIIGPGLENILLTMEKPADITAEHVNRFFIVGLSNPTTGEFDFYEFTNVTYTPFNTGGSVVRGVDPDDPEVRDEIPEIGAIITMDVVTPYYTVKYTYTIYYADEESGDTEAWWFNCNGYNLSTDAIFTGLTLTDEEYGLSYPLYTIQMKEVFDSDNMTVTDTAKDLLVNENGYFFPSFRVANAYITLDDWSSEAIGGPHNLVYGYYDYESDINQFYEVTSAYSYIMPHENLAGPTYEGEARFNADEMPVLKFVAVANRERPIETDTGVDIGVSGGSTQPDV